MKKRKGGLDSIIVTLMFILIVMISIPLFKTFANSNADVSKSSEKNSSSVIEESSNFLNNNMQGSFDPPFTN